ncbi:hypothetical protein [Aestuariibacter salexigens]|uniref:hypothetical protein n=1 Tax=Aestuariibacter salexigens TaxID=226010 RepID=UPI000428A6C5|nr:hypothetical protein [Aestuariibacter salexigens]
MPRSEKTRSPLSRLYQRQQGKVNPSARQGALLKTFAEDDYKRIAKLIQRWLQEDERNT